MASDAPIHAASAPPPSRYTYVRHGCRCAACRAANTEYQTRANARRRLISAAGHPEGRPVSHTTYRNWACRCQGCTAAQVESMRQYWDARRAREVAS